MLLCLSNTVIIITENATDGKHNRTGDYGKRMSYNGVTTF